MKKFFLLLLVCLFVPDSGHADNEAEISQKSQNIEQARLKDEKDNKKRHLLRDGQIMLIINGLRGRLCLGCMGSFWIKGESVSDGIQKRAIAGGASKDAVKRNAILCEKAFKDVLDLLKEESKGWTLLLELSYVLQNIETWADTRFVQNIGPYNDDIQHVVNRYAREAAGKKDNEFFRATDRKVKDDYARALALNARIPVHYASYLKELENRLEILKKSINNALPLITSEKDKKEIKLFIDSIVYQQKAVPEIAKEINRLCNDISQKLKRINGIDRIK